MLYLICTHDSKQRIAQLDTPADLKTSFWKEMLEFTSHKNILYPYDLFSLLDKKPLANRVNIIYANVSRRKLPTAVNAIITNNIKEVVPNYQDAQDDLYVLGTNKETIEAFAKYADYLITFETEELGFTKQSLVDSVNLADFNLLREEKLEKYTIRYFVKHPENFLGY